MSLNQVQIIGNLGRDPDVKGFDDGNKVANISIATTEKWKDRNTGEQKEATEWHRVVLRGGVAGVAERFLTKGSRVFVQGKLKTRQYEQDGQTKYVTEIVVAGASGQLVMLDGKGGSEAAPAPAQSQSGQRSAYAGGGGSAAVDSDEIPF